MRIKIPRQAIRIVWGIGFLTPMLLASVTNAQSPREQFQKAKKESTGGSGATTNAAMPSHLYQLLVKYNRNPRLYSWEVGNLGNTSFLNGDNATVIYDGFIEYFVASRKEACMAYLHATSAEINTYLSKKDSRPGEFRRETERANESLLCFNKSSLWPAARTSIRPLF